MTPETKTLLERIEASVEVLNGFGGGGTWRAEPLKASLEGTWSIKRGTYGMSDQLADVFAQVNFGEGDRQDAEGVAKAMVEARNTSRHLLTEAAAEIPRLEAENTALKAEIANLKSRQITAHGTVEFGGVTWQFYRSDERENDRGHWATNELQPLGVFIWARNDGFYINADEYGPVKFLSVFDAMQAAIDYAEGEA